MKGLKKSQGAGTDNKTSISRKYLIYSFVRNGLFLEKLAQDHLQHYCFLYSMEWKTEFQSETDFQPHSTKARQLGPIDLGSVGVKDTLAHAHRPRSLLSAASCASCSVSFISCMSCLLVWASFWSTWSSVSVELPADGGKAMADPKERMDDRLPWHANVFFC